MSINKEFHNRKPRLSQLIEGRIPPQALELEESVLGAMLLQSDKMADVLDIIHNDEVFYNGNHQIIFGVMRSMAEKGAAVDLNTVTVELRKRGELERIGGSYFLAQITMAVVSAAHVEDHARKVMEMWVARQTIALSMEAVAKAYEGEDCFETLKSLESDLQALNTSIDNSGKTTTVSSGQVGNVVMRQLYAAQDRKEAIPGVPTGFVDLDTLTYGWHSKNLIVVGARPGQGKTALAIHFILTAARAGEPVMFFSLEMSSEEITKRALANLSGIDFSKVKSEQLTPDELERVRQASITYAAMPITIDDQSALHVTPYRRRIKRWREKNPKGGLVLVDYLQLMDVTRLQGMSTNDTVSMKSGALKSSAKDFNVPVIALSQLNRELDKEKRPPRLSDLRDSGSIEQDANVVIFIHHEGGTQLIVAKNRDGQADSVKVKFIGAKQQWANIEDVDFNNYQHFKPYSTAIVNAAPGWADEGTNPF